MVEQQFEIISFDLFNTLIHVERKPGHEWKQEIAKVWELTSDYPVDLSLDEFFQIYRKKMAAKHRRLTSPGPGEDFKEQLLSDFIEDILNDGRRDPRDLGDLAVNIATDYFRNSLDDTRIYSSVHGLLSRLKEKYKLVLTSDHSWPPNGHDILDKFGLRDYFDNIVFSGEADYRKPSPCIFDQAIEGLELSCKNKLLHVGDYYLSDIAGIISYGGEALWIDHKDGRKSLTEQELAKIYRVITAIQHFPGEI